MFIYLDLGIIYVSLKIKDLALKQNKNPYWENMEKQQECENMAALHALVLTSSRWTL